MSEKKEVCGIIMPISSIDGCSETHWAEVLDVLSDSIDNAGFEANLVSNADDVGLIHKRIIQNLYENPIVVCDVSSKNANVMFELGMRLAFDKPTIIVKDDKTSYSFDTSSIEHIEYPRDLRFSSIVDFKSKLSEKIKATIKKSKEDPNHTTFLKHFGEFKVAKLDKKEVSGEEFIIDEIKGLKLSMQRLESNIRNANNSKSYLTIPKTNQTNMEKIRELIEENNPPWDLSLEQLIAKSLKKGFSKSKIMSTYKSQGYTENEIFDCISNLHTE
ncbi:hypothetical protein OO007_19080 [Cocleimonas sp. KMM 6892]|uniref:hypothetical protein n=1 Tax=unclassified Cocleimonas TaxID=2639732 RepID=UPI002DBE3678|nr:MULTISPECIES: hypothetical protein [unclassified Cocleimonas]MEB8434350.1 hypothetical protein [Cocleimonas sp. KMM 6892]MEC4717247.1 hypothetical protein [Cocleimonas sp. KMM 6895]MEC4746626.1 hypothetical protein [Cocleimonas sp. KMM 6896]